MRDRIHLLTNSYTMVDPLFGHSSRPVELDLGTGKGAFLVALASRYPDRLVLGSDIMIGRLRKVAGKAHRAGLENVELLRAESQALVGYQLPDACIDRAHLLCPDPWPKKRHRPRRLITTDFATRMARVLRPGGTFHFATDDVPYLSKVVGIFTALDTLFRLDPAPSAIADIADLKTDFERIWLHHGRQVPHVAFARC